MSARLNDGVQHILAQNNTEAFEKTIEVGRIPLLYPLKQVIKTQEEFSDFPLKEVLRSSLERDPPYTSSKKTSSSLKTQGHREEYEQTGLDKIPPFITTRLPPFSNHTSFMISYIFIKLKHRNIQVYVFLWVFISKGSHAM